MNVYLGLGYEFGLQRISDVFLVRGYKQSSSKLQHFLIAPSNLHSYHRIFPLFRAIRHFMMRDFSLLLQYGKAVLKRKQSAATASCET